MSRHDGSHTHGHTHGVGGLVLVVALVLFAAVAKAAGPAIRTAGHILSVTFEVIMIGLVVLAVTAVAAVLGWAGLKAHRWHSARQVQATPEYAVTAVTAVDHAEVGAPVLQAIEAPKPWLAVLPQLHQEVPEDRA